MIHGLVIGKFYPPHTGHHHLVDMALAHVDELTVLVLAASHESIPVDLRAAWMRRRHPAARVLAGIDDHPVDLDDTAIWDAHIAVFRSLCPEPVDVVFSSETYGDELARRMGARHHPVDPARAIHPVSGTSIRADPVAGWRWLEPSVRAHLVRRIAVVGAESTGTTTLARLLAEHYATRWVPEYGRKYTEALVAAGTAIDEIAWSDADFERIAIAQQAAEDAAAAASNSVLICDTDALATAIWQERYLGRSTPAVERLAASREYALHILTANDIPFVQDGVRDGERVRAWMTERFRRRLAERSGPWLEVRGTHAERLAAAIAAIDEILAAGWTFAEPLG
jgi:HTH-type transcriptional repressor of NAD biosynthesis genes